MFPPPCAPFVPPQFGIKLATEPWERAGASRLREAVFCREQALFALTDRDATDAIAQPIVAVDYLMGMAHAVVGTVRIHEADAAGGCWYGSRLAIDSAYRGVYGLGSGLIFRAVSTARARGCRTFLAHVQQQNVAFFRRLAWQPLHALTLHGYPHVLMQADLAAYPPSGDDAAVAMLRSGRAS
jgi:putative N-acetyltransferase (TIGR04045 family)